MSEAETKEMVPAIRFDGFDESWDQRKIGSVLTETKRPVELDDNTFYQLVTVKRRNGGVVRRIELKGRDILVKNYFELKSGDYLISKRQVVHGSNGSVPKELNGAVVSNEYLVVTDNKDISTKFWTLLTKRPEEHKRFFISSYGVDIEKLVFDVEDWKKRSITIPKPPEQNEITSFFQQLDALIAGHLAKREKLLQLKKSLLEKMFPKQGQDKPEIRFAEFDGSWNEERLTKIADIVGGGTPSTSVEEFWDGDIDWYSPTEIGHQVYASNSTKTITQLGLEKSSAIILPAEKTVLFTSRAGIGDMAILLKDGATNQGFQSFVVKEGFDTYFVYSSGRKIKDYALKHASGSTFLEISGKQLGKMELKVPKAKEQTKIGQLFKHTDSLIDQHQTQITKLLNIKQACLAKMFV